MPTTNDLGAAFTPPEVPVAREEWFCPSCGQPAPAFVGRLRVVICRPCRWIFEVKLMTRADDVTDEWLARQIASYDGLP